MVQSGPTSTAFLLAERILAIVATNMEKSPHDHPITNIETLLGSLGLFQRHSLLLMQPGINPKDLPQLQSHFEQPLQLLEKAFFSSSSLPATYIKSSNPPSFFSFFF